jgi:hypothetical protein
MKISFLEKILIAGAAFLVGALIYNYTIESKPKSSPKPKKRKLIIEDETHFKK